jgi:hypothetical protein
VPREAGGLVLGYFAVVTLNAVGAALGAWAGGGLDQRRRDRGWAYT